MLDSILPGVQHLQNIHPLVVHFPIALLTSALLFYLLAWIFRNHSLAISGFSMLVLGTLSAGAAVAAGLYAEDGVMIALSVRDHLLDHHEDLMLTTLGLSVLSGIWATAARPFPRKWRVLFLFLLLVMCGVMAVGADYGARMVYDYNAGGNACPQPIEFTK